MVNAILNCALAIVQDGIMKGCALQHGLRRAVIGLSHLSAGGLPHSSSHEDTKQAARGWTSRVFAEDLQGVAAQRSTLWLGVLCEQIMPCAPDPLRCHMNEMSVIAAIKRLVG